MRSRPWNEPAVYNPRITRPTHRSLSFAARLRIGACAILIGACAADAAAALTEAPRLSTIYELILQTRFEEAKRASAAACPPAPREACLTLDVVAAWWEIQLNPASRRLDDRLQAAAATAIAAAEQWTRREPSRGEAWFYLAGAYAPLVQWRVLRAQQLAAAREGKKIKDALERALALDPTITDAYFGLGLYHYYADVAPAALKILRWLLLLPGGDRAQGLREMLQARDAGALLRGEADYQLHWIYLWYEHEPSRALELLRSLDARYPQNPIFLQRIAEVERDYFHDHAASVAAWVELIARVRTGSAPRARLALAYFSLGVEYTHLGARDRAVDALTHAIDAAAGDDPDHLAARARAELRKF